MASTGWRISTWPLNTQNSEPPSMISTARLGVWRVWTMGL